MKERIKQAWAEAVDASVDDIDDWPVDRLAEAIDLIDEFDSYRSCMNPDVAKRLRELLCNLDLPIHFNVLDSLDTEPDSD